MNHQNKMDKTMQGTAEELRTNPRVTFFYEPKHMNSLVFAG